jgi:hypothetical protein
MGEVKESRSVNEAKEIAGKAIFDVIAAAVEEIRENEYALGDQAGRVRDLAYAFRLVSGGAQPGSVDVRK